MEAHKFYTIRARLDFGASGEACVACLLRQSTATFLEIASATRLSRTDLRQTLLSLLQHDIVHASMTTSQARNQNSANNNANASNQPKAIYQYKLNTKALLYRSRSALLLRHLQRHYERHNDALAIECIATTLVHHGKLTQQQLFELTKSSLESRLKQQQQDAQLNAMNNAQQQPEPQSDPTAEELETQMTRAFECLQVDSYICRSSTLISDNTLQQTTALESGSDPKIASSKASKATYEQLDRLANAPVQPTPAITAFAAAQAASSAGSPSHDKTTQRKRTAATLSPNSATATARRSTTASKQW
jgi:hypothetical protein